MATQRLSRLHKRILQWLVADHQRTKGLSVSSHEERMKALQRDKGTISRSLRILAQLPHFIERNPLCI